MDTYDTIKYILDTYSEYIDNLRIVDLKNLLLKDSNIKSNIVAVIIIDCQCLIDPKKKSIWSDKSFSIPYLYLCPKHILSIL